jgi:hypothetical protein
MVQCLQMKPAGIDNIDANRSTDLDFCKPLWSVLDFRSVPLRTCMGPVTRKGSPAFATVEIPAFKGTLVNFSPLQKVGLFEFVHIYDPWLLFCPLKIHSPIYRTLRTCTRTRTR